MPRQSGQFNPAVWNAILGLVFALGVVVCLTVAIPRSLVELEHRTVEVVVDAGTVHAVAMQHHMAQDDLLARLHALGVNSLAITETTVADAVAAGWVSIIRPEELQPTLFPNGPAWLQALQHTDAPPTVFIAWQPTAVPEWLDEPLRLRLQAVGALVHGSDDAEVWQITAQRPSEPGQASRPVDVLAMGLGFAPEMLALAAENSMRIALRPLDSPKFSAPEVAHRVSPGTFDAGSQPLFIFDGASVPGDPGLHGEWVREVSASGGKVAWIEFAGQHGLSRLITALNDTGIRLHSISSPELHKISPERAIARWVRAVKERGIRAVYVRLYTAPPTAAQQDLVTLNEQYIGSVTRSLERAGFVIGEATAMRLAPVPFYALITMFSAIGIGAVWLVRRFVRLSHWLEGSFVLGLVVLLHVLGGDTGRQAGALLAAIVFPVLATLVALDKLDDQPSGSPLKAAGRSLWQAAAISLLGALFLVGLLSETRFALGLSLFAGVKLMHVIPPLGVALLTIWGTPVSQLRDIPGRIGHLLTQRIPLGYLVAIGAVGLISALVVLRTGTDILPVSGLEQRFRELLESGLGVRPRNKEFLLGHPIFFLTAYLVIRGDIKGIWRATFAGVASVGQLSLVNTFAHIHSPVLLSLQRTLYGLIFGWLCGLLLTSFYKFFRSRVQKHAPKQGSDLRCV